VLAAVAARILRHLGLPREGSPASLRPGGAGRIPREGSDNGPSVAHRPRLS
jgi:hypothetical protein